MEIETIKEDAKQSIVNLLNRSLQIEYDLLFNYPRVIDKLVNVDRIQDEQIVNALEIMGKDSLRHFDEVDKLIKKLGGESIWRIDVIDLSQDAEEILDQQLEKEEWVVSWYKEAKQVAEQNKVKVRGFLGRPVGGSDKLPEDFVNVNDIISMLDRHILDELRHQRLVKDSIDKLRTLKNK